MMCGEQLQVNVSNVFRQSEQLQSVLVSVAGDTSLVAGEGSYSVFVNVAPCFDAARDVRVLDIAGLSVSLAHLRSSVSEPAETCSPVCDSEGIRTPAGRAQWISSPSP